MGQIKNIKLHIVTDIKQSLRKSSKEKKIDIHLMIATYACIALGIVCDYYFVPSLEIICYHLHIQEDVGGATLMCMGTTVFNLLLVVGTCGLIAYENTKLTWWPVVRDVTSYCVSIVALAIVMIDKKVSWQEA